MKIDNDINVRHRSGLVVEGVTVISNPIKLEPTTLEWNYKFVTEDEVRYIYRDLHDHFLSAGGRFFNYATPETRRWEMIPYAIVHQELGRIGIAAIRIYSHKHSMGTGSPIEFAIFGHVEINDGFRKRGFGVPAYVAAQTSLPEGYRLAKTNDAKYMARAVWEKLDTYGLVDRASLVTSETGVKPAKVFLKELIDK